MSRTLAADIGGTRIKIASLQDGKVERFTMIPAHSEGRLADRLGDMKQALWEVAQGRPQDYDGLGIALPSLVDPAAGCATEIYAKFEDAPEIDFRAWSREEFGLPLAVEQDSKAALLGEVHYGCAQGVKNAVMPEYSALACYVKAGVPQLLAGEMTREEFSAATSIVRAGLSDAPVAGFVALEDPEAELRRYVAQAALQPLDDADRECLGAMAAYADAHGWDGVAASCRALL